MTRTGLRRRDHSRAGGDRIRRCGDRAATVLCREVVVIAMMHVGVIVEWGAPLGMVAGAAASEPLTGVSALLASQPRA